MAVSTDDQKAGANGSLRWPRTARPPQRQADSRSLYGYLLDLDDDLAEEFDIRSRVSARQLATVKLLEAEVGDGDLSNWFDVARGGMGLLVLEGMLAFEMRVGDRTTTELVGAGDLLQAPTGRGDELLEGLGTWKILCPTLPGPARRGVRRPGPAVAADRPGDDAQGQPADDRCQRGAGDHGPTAVGDAAGPAFVASGRTLGASRAGGNPADAAAHSPPARSVWPPPSGRRYRMRSPGSRRPGW